MDYADQTKRLLDSFLGAVRQQRLVAAGHLVGPGLSKLQEHAEAAGMQDQVVQAMKQHEAFAVCMQDPYTKRAFDKPRGYAGDPVMLDYIYRPADHGLKPEGRAVFSLTTSGPTGMSIAYRRSFLRSHLDQTVRTEENARILSVASGHCRELDDWMRDAPAGQFEYVAMDQDEASCCEVAKSYGAGWLTIRKEGMKKLLRPSFDIGNFNLIYSAGLYDYLPKSIAMVLTEQLAARLRPGGTLLLANFVPTTKGRAYMELVMDWKLIWRTSQQLCELFPLEAQATVRTHLDPHENVAYATWKKPLA